MENRREMLAQAPLLPLLVKMSLPAMIGMFVMASYNVVDTIFIGWGVGPLGNGFVMSVALGFATLAAGIACLDPLIAMMGADARVADYARHYLGIVFLGNPLVIVGMLFNNTIRSEGNTRYAMYSMVLPAVLNVFLDPLFIFGFKMGMAGAAWATVIGQLVTLLWNLRYYLTGRRSLIALRLSRMPLRWVIDAEILGVGVSEFAR